jgi:hypothetical protein
MGASGGVSGVWGWYAHPDWGRGRCCDGPRCAVLPQQGYTPVSRHNTHVTAKHICHKTSHVPQHNTYVTAQYTCDSTIHMSQHNKHVTKQAVHALQHTDYIICSKRSCTARVRHKFAACTSAVSQHCCTVQICIWQTVHVSRGHESCPAHDN